MNRKQSTRKGSTKGKAEGGKRLTVKERARRILDEDYVYDEDTRNAIKNSLNEGDPNLAEMVRRAEEGETILDVSGDGDDEFKARAHDYAQKAYDAALAHFETNHKDPFALSRLAIVFDETDPKDVHIVVTLPGAWRASHVEDADVRDWIKTAELIARTLEHPDCPDALKKAIGTIYTEEMLDGADVDWMSPEVLRVQLPLVMLSGSGTNHVCDDDKALRILTLLSSELVSDETDRDVRASLGMQ